MKNKIIQTFFEIIIFISLCFLAYKSSIFLAIGVVVLGALGYIENIIQIKPPKKYYIILLILFLFFSVFQIFSSLKTDSELTELYEYGEVAIWNYKGAKSISKDYSLPGPLSGWIDDYVKDTPTGKQVRYDDEAIFHYQDILRKYPKYPFSYYFLAEAFRLKGNNELTNKYAKQSIEILQITNKIPNHSPDHDDALRNIKSILSK